MITFIKNNIDRAALLDINKTLKAITLYAWVATGIFFACYLYFVGAITFSVVKERGLATNTKTLISQMGEAELAYLSTQKELTQSYAASIGFVKPGTVAFAASKRALAWNVGR